MIYVVAKNHFFAYINISFKNCIIATVEKKINPISDKTSIFLQKVHYRLKNRIPENLKL